MQLRVHYQKGRLNLQGGFISQGVAKITHDLGHDRYNVITQKRNRTHSVIVTGVYSTYFTVETRSNGSLISLNFDFTMTGNNY